GTRHRAREQDAVALAGALVAQLDEGELAGRVRPARAVLRCVPRRPPGFLARARLVAAVARRIDVARRARQGQLVERGHGMAGTDVTGVDPVVVEILP